MGYELSSDPGRVDVDAVWRYLSTDAYWARWRTRADFEQQLRNAWRIIAAYDIDGATVSFARAVSDGVSDAFLMDVFVLPDHRGNGLGKRIVAEMIDNGPGADFRWVLFTDDAHGLYAQFGFDPPDAKVMIRNRPG